MGSVDRRPYLGASSITQYILDQSQDNLTNGLIMVADVQDPSGGTIRVSDRSVYVDDFFYFPKISFPVITRTIGEWLSNILEFSSLQIKINNTDGEFNYVMPGGANYNGWIGARVTIKVGISENASTFTQVFTGVVTDVAGFQRDTDSFTLVCRSDFEKVNNQIPDQFLTSVDFPYLADDKIGTAAPIIYGDWSIELLNNQSRVPAIIVNENDTNMNTAFTEDVRCVIASTPISVLNTSSVELLRGETRYPMDSSDIAIVAGTNNTIIDITQNGTTLIDGNPYTFESSDEFFVKVNGIDLGSYSDNPVAQAKDMLKRFGGLVDADFDSSWTSFMNKGTPAESSIVDFKTRIWIKDEENLLEVVASLLEQVRLEIFVTRDNKFSLSSLHLDEFAAPANIDFTFTNYDIVRDSFKPRIDERNNWNRAKADYGYDPIEAQSAFSTPLFRNNASIAQAGKEISKLVSFPNLYREADVILNLKEMLKLAGGFAEMIYFVSTPRAFLLELSQFVNLEIDIGSVNFISNGLKVPCMVREIGYDPNGLAIPIKLWSFQMIEYTGYEPGYPGITGGKNINIVQE